jgi:hypothetical protein
MIFKSIFSRLLRKLYYEFGKNIDFELQRAALKSTVKYINMNMQFVTPVDSKWKLHDLALQTISIDGMYLEFGVYQAETVNYVAKKINHVIYGFDSFQGLPESWRNGYEKGAFAMDGLPKVRDNVVLVKGWFNESLPVFLNNVSVENVAYLHIDCDLYSSTKTVLDLLGNRIKVGTVIVFDEYFNYPGWQNDEFKAFKEFISDNELNYKYITYNSKHEQVVVQII